MAKIKFPLVRTAKDFLPLKEYFFDKRYRLIIGLVSLLAVDFLVLQIPIVLKWAIDDLTYKNATPGILPYSPRRLSII